MSLNIADIRRQFPILSRKIDGHPLIYLDSAATAQMPEAVADAMRKFDTESRANVHRGMHVLAEEATVAYENARGTVATFIGAKPHEVIFTKNCTEGLNLVAKSWGMKNLRKGDAVALSRLEHHSSIVPWLQLKDEIGIEIVWIGIDETGMPKMEELDAALATKKVKMIAVTGQSNVLGVRPDLSAIIKKAHAAGALVTIDAAQLIAHHQIDVATLDCDFLAFSGHKLYGPTGIGVLYGKRKLLEAMPPFLGGGGMIGEVKKTGFTVADIPQKFEAGTPPLTQAVGLAAAIEWIGRFSWKDIEDHESGLINTAIASLAKIPNLKILGSEQRTANSEQAERLSLTAYRSGCMSFSLPAIHPHDLTEILGRKGICLRAGHHCCQPLHDHFGIAASTRLSVGIYNTAEEIGSLVPAVEEALKIL